MGERVPPPENRDASHAPALAALEARLAIVEAELTRLKGLNLPPEELGPVEALRQTCRERGISVSADGFVRERDAAVLLSRSASCLRLWRITDGRLPFKRLGKLVEYSLSTLADFLAKREE